MVTKLRQRWQLGRVGPGDGSALREYRIWQLFSRSLYFLELADPPGPGHVFAVDVRYLADTKTRKQHEDAVGRSPVALYRDGAQLYPSNLPTAFPVPGGVIEVATSATGLKRMHYVSEGGSELALRPHRLSQEGLRARFARRFPRASVALGALSLVVLLSALVVGLLSGVEALTRSPGVAEHVGRFTSPVSLPGWGNVALVVAGMLAAGERALRLRHHWLIDGAAS